MIKKIFGYCKNVLVYLIISLFFCNVFTKPVAATGEFQADYDVLYAVSPSGTTVVTQNITLTNNLTNLYPKEYSILLDTTNVKNIIAYDAKGQIHPSISQRDGKTDIHLIFNDQVVGLGKQLHFTLRFENEDIAKKLGSIWEITVPGVAGDADLSSYYVTLDVPPTFGPNAYTAPSPAEGKKWNKQQMTNGGISAAYGTKQLFSLGLSYFIENTTITTKTYEVALPPDGAFQKVMVSSINPKPRTIHKDADGNWLAQYDLAPAQKVNVTAQLLIQTFLTPQQNYTENPPDVATYTKALKYWESLDPKIADLAQTYHTPRAIYDYVSRTLTYDYNRVNQSPIRKGALQALVTPTTAICMEFTDLFIAIARAAGIPAREAVGYAYTTNTKLRPLSLVSDVLHAWPEYYDSQKHVWVPVDPTWASTTGGVNYFDKLDFNHVVFAIHGQNSEYPYPAGFYKQSGTTGKDVQVSFLEALIPLPVAKLTVSYQMPDTITAGFPAKGIVRIENEASVSVDNVSISVQSTPVDVALHQDNISLPPYGSLEIPFTIVIKDYLYQGQGRLVTTVSGDTNQFVFNVRPSYWLLIPISAAVAIIGSIAFLLYKRTNLWRR